MTTKEFRNEYVYSSKVLNFEQMLKDYKAINYNIIAKELNEMEYDKFLNTSYWKTISSHIKKLANYKCKHCESTKNLVTHHWTYRMRGYEILHLKDLDCICQICHTKIHDTESEYYKTLEKYKKELLLLSDNKTIEICKEWSRLMGIKEYDKTCYEREDFLKFSHNEINLIKKQGDNTMLDQLYNITKTAKLLGVTPRTVYRWEKQCKIKFIKVNGFNKVSESEIKRLRGEK